MVKHIHMKPLFFFLFIFISFTATAQFPAPRHNGYRKYYESWQESLIEVVNKRNKFVEYSVGRDMSMFEESGPKGLSEFIGMQFDGKKYFYNGRDYYSTYRRGNRYCYAILLYDTGFFLYVESKYNDAEFKKCKKMLDKQAAIIKRDGSYYYPDYGR